MILRAAALAEAADGFRGLPITVGYTKMTATSHVDPSGEEIVGRVGNNVRLRDPYLLASVVIWGRQALDQIASGELGAFSIGYTWEVERRGGTFRGQAFDARALTLSGHHVALVERSRGGDAVRLRLPDHVRQQFQHEQRVRRAIGCAGWRGRRGATKDKGLRPAARRATPKRWSST